MSASLGTHRCSRCSGLVLLGLLMVLSRPLSAASRPSLPERYKKWLQQDVVYIISNDEKKSFLDLPTDADRDRFVDHFWDVRNPTPGSPDNSYRDEHYRRIEYANQFFGHASHTPGWRTDMGRIYITLGEPAQRQKLLGLQKVTPMEIWFYSNTNPALPPFFYVIFYQRDPMDEFRLYHPYSDGPEKLINSVVGPTRQQALDILTQDAGKDVARETLSLLPDEPVDFNSGTISLASDVMLATIQDLANNPISKADLESRRSLLEDVSHRLVLGGEFLDVVTLPLRDVMGNTNLHYLLRLRKPDDFAVGQSAKEGYYYSILISATVDDGAGRRIFSDERKLSRAVSASELAAVKEKVFGYEGLLPVPPGKYKLRFELSNLLSGVAFRQEVEVTIPQVPSRGLEVTNLVPFTDAQAEPAVHGVQPFMGAGVKFVPRGATVQLSQGEPLRFFYQVWAPSLVRASLPGGKIDVEYVYGRLGAQDSQTIAEEIPLNQLDHAGSVINGKQIQTADLPPGNYRLVMTLHDSESQTKVYRTLNFGVSATTSAPSYWDVSEDNAAPTEAAWQRASCYLANGEKREAVQWFRAAYSNDRNNEKFRDKLIELYFEQEEYAKIVDLYSNGGLNNSTDEQTIVRIAESFSRLGDVAKAVNVMESGTQLNPKSGFLLLGLAQYYRKAGNPDKAADAEQRGRQLTAATPAL